jgi:hypothetical protein
MHEPTRLNRQELRDSIRRDYFIIIDPKCIITLNSRANKCQYWSIETKQKERDGECIPIMRTAIDQLKNGKILS